MSRMVGDERDAVVLYVADRYWVGESDEKVGGRKVIFREKELPGGELMRNGDILSRSRIEFSQENDSGGA